MLEIKETLDVERVCKHSVRYDSKDSNAGVKSVYVSKLALGNGDPQEYPQSIILTIKGA